MPSVQWLICAGKGQVGSALARISRSRVRSSFCPISSSAASGHYTRFETAWVDKMAGNKGACNHSAIAFSCYRNTVVLYALQSLKVCRVSGVIVIIDSNHHELKTPYASAFRALVYSASRVSNCGCNKAAQASPRPSSRFPFAVRVSQPLPTSYRRLVVRMTRMRGWRSASTSTGTWDSEL